MLRVSSAILVYVFSLWNLTWISTVHHAFHLFLWRAPYTSFKIGHGPLTRYVKLRVAHAPGMPGTSPPLERSPPPPPGTFPTPPPPHWLQRMLLVSDPDMHHGTCVSHVPWCMSGSLTHGGRENVPGIRGACTTHNFTCLSRGPLNKIVDLLPYEICLIDNNHYLTMSCHKFSATVFQWFRARLQYLQCVSIGHTTAVLHEAIDL